MITLKCTLNRSIISCDIKQPYILPSNSIYENMLSEDLKNTLDGKVGFSDYATSDKAGVVAIEEFYGLHMDANGVLQLNAAEANDIDNRKDSLKATFKAITCTTLDYAVRSVRPNVTSTIPSTLVVNTIYDNMGITESLSFALPNGQYGDFIQVDFYSGATPTTLTISNTQGIVGFDLTPEPNTMYSLYFDLGTMYSEGNASALGWRFGYAAYPHEEV